MWTTYVGRERVAPTKSRARAERFFAGRRSLLWVRCFMFLIAPLRTHVFAVVAIADMIASQVVPEKSGGGIVDVGLVVFQRILVRDLPLEIIGAFFSAIGDRPGLLVVVRSDRCGGPEMAVA